MTGGALANYLPGCYANLRPAADESLPGFLLRLAEQNRYAGIADFLSSVLSGLNSQSLRPQLMEIRKSPALLTRLGRIACGDPNVLLDFRLLGLGSDAVMMHGCRVPTYGLAFVQAAVCPHCLDDTGYCREEWELAPVVVCSRHECELISHCAQCGHSLGWNRGSVTRCGHCGASLGAATQQPLAATVPECRTAEDFSALADFRVELNDGEVTTMSWESALNITRALSQPATAWLSFEFRHRRDYSELPVAERRTLLACLAECRNERATYVLAAMRPRFREKLRHVRCFSPEDYLAKLVFGYLMNFAYLSSEVARTLAGPPESLPVLAGAEQFNGRPPMLHEAREIADFVGVDMETYRALRRSGRVPVRSSEDDFGVDIDDLLRLRYFVTNRLAGLNEIRKMVGLDVGWEDLCLFPVRLIWEPLRQLEKRVPYDELRAAQLLLAQRIDGMDLPEHPVWLAEIIANQELPFLTLSSFVAELLSGRFGRGRWREPYRWVDIELDETELERCFPTLALTRDGIRERYCEWACERYFSSPRWFDRPPHRL